MSDTYTMSKTDRILSGSKTTSRSAENAAQYFLQGIEIQEIGMFRSGLPVLGRNPRYKLIDVTITGSISDQNYFMDVASASDAGLGQDSYQKIEGTLYNRARLVKDGQIITDINESTTIRNVTTYFSNRGFSGDALSDRVLGWVRSVLKNINTRNPEWEIGEGYVGNELKDEIYYEVGTYSSKTVANVKFPDGKIKQSISFGIGSEDYGYGKEYIDSVPYFDLAKYDAIEYIHNSGPTGMMPIVGSFISYDEKLSYNGIVEPFEIRRRALGLSIFLEDEGQPGSVAGFRDEVITDFSYDSRENDLRAEFFEDVHSKGFSGYGTVADQASALLEAEFVSNINKNMYPFIERDNADLLISDSGIKSIQLSMDPTLDEGTLPVTHVDMAVGFDAESRDRVNSIVFRGMTRR